ncbi:DUF6265 family protein [Flagellimonas meridianipacifica]|uniref:DUF6265 domain-containing protein n=1 Tax=Flagellimonas meridianipacifica TaxID=1080225 RepID=A0A2T0MIE3_9FLAO|nr:DUF6265 family protein [Allomuricauda pacifica]PRX57276.1 hypothetical protein CLV81_1279 [Allomuricauda pacifica]
MKTNVFLALMMTMSLSAQQTLQLEKNQESPKASLSEVSLLAGHWKGEAFGGMTEEIWSPPQGNSMMFVFRLMNDGEVTFYEIGHILQQNETLILQLKHFNGDLKGWEEKDETVDFKLVKIEDNKVYFEGMTIEKMDKDHVNFHVLVSESGKEREVIFRYERVKT